MTLSSLTQVVEQTVIATRSSPARPRPARPGMSDAAREIARRLLDEADQSSQIAMLLREAAHELVKLAILIGPAPEAQLYADYVRLKLGLRHRGSALLLLELLAHPGVPQRAGDLAPLVCTRLTNTSSVKVFVHDLRGALGGLMIDDAIRLRGHQGYYVVEDTVPRIMALLQ